MFRRWGVVALIAGASVLGVAGIAAACGIDAYCPVGPRVDAHVSSSGGGYVASRAFYPVGDVSVPAVVVPIPHPGPIGPVGDGALVADTTVDASGGSLRVGPTHLYARGVGDVSVPAVVVPIPHPGPVGPIGDVGRVVGVVEQRVNDLLPSREVGGGGLPVGIPEVPGVSLPGPPATTHG